MAKDVIVSKLKKVKTTFKISDKRREEYLATYERLMKRAEGRVYAALLHERHHILPRCMGGTEEDANIAILTYEEHFLAHWLLTKIKIGQERRLALFSLRRMAHKSKKHPYRIVAGWQYALARRANHAAMIGNTINVGRKQSEAWVENLRNRMMGNTLGTRLKGVRQSPERRAKTSRALTNNPNVIAARMGNTNTKRRPVRCLNDGRVFPMMKEAAQYYGVNGTSVWLVCNKRYKSVRGYVFEYI
jgi:hypothetical protein